MNETTTDRQQRISDARSVLAFLEANPEVGLPHPISAGTHWTIFHPDSSAEFIQQVAVLGDCGISVSAGIWTATRKEKFGEFELSVYYDSAGELMKPDLDALAGVEVTAPSDAEIPDVDLKNIFPSDPATLPPGIEWKDTEVGPLTVRTDARRIRIISDAPGLWYNSKVGEVFNVYRLNGSRYEVFDPSDGELKAIEPEHAVLISERSAEGRKAKRIRITGFTPSDWYSEGVGVAFTVLNASDTDWIVRSVASPDGQAVVRKSDAEVIDYADINEDGF